MEQLVTLSNRTMERGGTEPTQRIFRLSAGEFRGLEWSGGAGTAVFLHGLNGMADAWRELVAGLDEPTHLVGHSMEARVAVDAAARHPKSFRSVVVVDIGPEAWQQNIRTKTKSLEARPETFMDRDEALAVARFVVGEHGQDAAERFVDDQLRVMADGSTPGWRLSTCSSSR